MKKKKIKIGWQKLARKAGSAVYNAVIALLLVVASALVFTTFKIPGNYKLLSVQSGSMEPALHVGSVVVVKPATDYKVGDVVTVVEPANPQVSLTHRVVEVKETDGLTSYVTKGDANDDADTEERLKQNVVGKVIFPIPWMGYAVTFAKTQAGFILMIIVPAVVIIYNELLTIKHEAVKLIRERKKRRLTEMEKIEVVIGKDEMAAERGVKKFWRRIQQGVAALFILTLLVQGTGTTGAYLVDTETTTASMTAGDFRPPTALDFYWQRRGQAAGFVVTGTEVPGFVTLSYRLTYPTPLGIAVVVGERTIGGAETVRVEDLTIGSCSSGGTCHYDTLTGPVELIVVLHGVVARTITTSLVP